MTKLLSLLLTLFMVSGLCLSQDQTVRRDTSAMPRLEIPEITIVGKKAITLPFARKGEIYDVKVYDAPPADTTILDQRPTSSFPIGSLPRYEEPLVPWHVSAKGSLGSFTTGNFHAYIDYLGPRWGIYGNGGIGTTRGHTDNASGSAFRMEAIAHSLISTDNELLKSFRVSGGMNFLHDSYGMFGIHPEIVTRSRNNFTLDTRFGSLNRQTNVIDLSLIANLMSVTDTRLENESQVTTASPELHASYSTDISNVRFISQVTYKNSSFNYKHHGGSADLLGWTLNFQWQLMELWNLDVGGIYYNGSDSDGTSRSLLLPFAAVKWTLDHDREVSFWYKPEMHLDSYTDHLQRNPYLMREISIRPERVPINLGSTFWFNSYSFSIELEGSFAKGSNKSITIADSGMIRLDYVDANKFTIRVNGTVKPSDELKATFAGMIQPAFENGSSVQLPMVPIIQLSGRGEYTPANTFTLWSSVEYWGKQNVDRAGTKTLGDRFLVGVGASAHIIPKTVFSIDISNLLNQKYEWWNWYTAPGITFKLEAKVNFL